MIINLNGERGFILNRKWYPNTWRGHEGNAYYLIQENGWYDEWLNSKMSTSDFIIKCKGAIQIASEYCPKTIILSNPPYSEMALRKIIADYNLIDYISQWI